MKYYRTILTVTLLLLMQPVLAADDSMSSGEMMNYIGYGAVMFMLILFLIVLLFLLKAFGLLTKLVFKYDKDFNKGWQIVQLIKDHAQQVIQIRDKDCLIMFIQPAKGSVRFVKPSSRAAISIKPCPTLMVCLGFWFILRGINLDIPYLSPAKQTSGQNICR